jgi:hypothetical protein
MGLKRIGLCVVLPIAGLWLLYVPAMHVIAWYFAHQAGKENPVTALVPKTLVDRSMVDLKDGTTVSRFGYIAQFPWAKTTVVRDFKSISMMSFEDGPSLIMENPAAHMDMLDTAPEQERVYRDDLRVLLGDEATRSHYHYAKAELKASPEDVSFFASRRNNARVMMLLTMKSLDTPNGSTAIYDIAAPGIRGFQFGDPQKGPTRAELLLFDGHDRALKMIFSGPGGGAKPALTQGQINAILASVKAPR